MRHQIWRFSCCGLCLWLATATISQAQRPANPRQSTTIKIVIQSSAGARKSLVTVGDIARVTGEPAYLRDRISRIDVAKVSADRIESVSAAQVGIRLLLAGVPEHAYELRGERCRVRLEVPIRPTTVPRPVSPEKNIIFTETFLLNEIRDALANEMNADHEDIKLRFLQPLKLTEKLEAAESTRIYLPTRPKPGVLIMTIGFLDKRGKLVGSIRASTEFNQIVTVPVATKRINSGEAFGPTNVRLERHRRVNGIEPADSESLVGRIAKRSVSSGKTIRSSDVRISALPVKKPRKAPAPYIVKSRDSVELVARKGGVVVSIPNAQILQSGRRGDLVQVRNPRSQQIVTGRVVSGTRVEIRL